MRPACLSQVGVKNPEGVAIPSVRNDAAFLYTLVGVTSGAITSGVWLAFGVYDLRTASAWLMECEYTCSSGGARRPASR
jgi:hypothetical protein